jgi:MFS family permease
MIGVGETYLPAFALAVGLGEVVSGLLVTIPMLAGALFQLITPYMVRHLKSHREWVVTCAFVQCLCFVPLLVAAVLGHLPPTTAFLIAGLYWGMGMALSPAWNCWMTTLVPPLLRTSFFSKRTRFTQGAALSGFLLGGFLLHSSLKDSHPTYPFALLFGLAFLARGVSALSLSKISEPTLPSPEQMKSVSLVQMLSFFRHKKSGSQLLQYLLLLQFSVQIAAPFFTPFMLGALKFTYYDYVFLVGASYAAKILTVPWLGRIAKIRGAEFVMSWAGIGIATVPFLWLFTDNFYFLMGIQALTGMFWAAYELSTLLLIMSRLGQDERVGLLTNYNLLNAISMTLGSLLGASILESGFKKYETYHLLFFISGVVRCGSVFLLQKISGNTKKVLPSALSTLDFRQGITFLNRMPLHKNKKKKKAS